MRNRLVAFVLSACCSLPYSAVTAAPRTQAQMRAAAAKAINKHRSARRMAPGNGALSVLNKTENYEIIGYATGGFAVIATDDLAPEVLGVSASDYSHGLNPNFQWWLQAAGSAVRHAVATSKPLKTTKPDTNKYPSFVEPMMTTRWNQGTPYNNLCPTYSGSVRCLTGCVATAMAQVLCYHKTPAHGEGQRTIYYPQGHSQTGQAVTANFSEDYYDWANMIDDYKNTAYTQQQADAVALLMRDCGVAANMGYGGPDEGSGAYSQDAAVGLRQYFGFDEAQCLERDHYSEAQWMDMVYRELSENGPLYYGGADYMMGGHAFVLHGYRDDGKVYVNWGWSGEDDGYYDIAILNPDSYQFSYGQDMIIGIHSTHHSLLRSEEVTLKSEGSLQKTIEDIEAEDPIGSLSITGPLNSDDLRYLRHLAGRTPDGEESGGQLRILDLTKATLPAKSLPTALFKDCNSLRRVRLPEGLEHIGAECFSGCSHLYELRIPARQVPVLDGSGVFSGLNFGSVTLYVRSGLRSKYRQKAQWNDFLEKNIVEFGTSIKVRNMLRKYGEENPSFIYTVSGGSIKGEPELICEATPESPAGRYPIRIGRGTIEGDDEIDFIDGYLVVQKIPATATIGHFSRPQGEPNPEFSFSNYEGLISTDSIPAWIVPPVFYCEADEWSPEGNYPILVINEAEAQSYDMTFVAGMLTVETPTAISDIVTSRPSTIYTLDGRQLRGRPERGLYIRNGRKMAVVRR